MNEEKTKTSGKGIYVYCVTSGNTPLNFGKIGVNQSEVYTISYKDICAVVHDCKAEPYKSEDPEIVKKWIRMHQEIIDKTAEKFGTVLPMSFDVIIKGENKDPKENVVKWLGEEYEAFKEKMKALEGKQEYGIQLFWNREEIGEKFARSSEEIARLRKEKARVSEGKAYFTEQKIKKELKCRLENEADKRFKEFYSKVKEHTTNLKVEKVKKAQGDEQMIANLSCLVPDKKVKELGAALDAINNQDGFKVRFTGPWPPYSFVTSG